jgi:hypothetical protein
MRGELQVNRKHDEPASDAIRMGFDYRAWPALG